MLELGCGLAAPREIPFPESDLPESLVDGMLQDNIGSELDPLST